jgi:hypothetical protein
MAIEYMKSAHTIDGTDFKLSKLQPTSMSEFITRKLVITTIADTVEVEFTPEGFELFKAIISEY